MGNGRAYWNRGTSDLVFLCGDSGIYPLIQKPKKTTDPEGINAQITGLMMENVSGKFSRNDKHGKVGDNFTCWMCRKPFEINGITNSMGYAGIRELTPCIIDTQLKVWCFL